MRKIYVDMDGVVADFDMTVGQILGRELNASSQHNISPEEWNIIALYPRLYLDLPLMEHATHLVGYCTSLVSKYNTQFLTALPLRKTLPLAQEDKIEWCRKYFPGYKVNFGPRSVDKWKWCEPNSGDILIDDRMSNIEEWCEKGGGIGILYQNRINETLEHLDQAMKTNAPTKFV